MRDRRVETADSNGLPPPLARCCTRHRDWATLAEHLLAEFSEVAPRQVLDTLRHARYGVEFAALEATDALATGETIARFQLLLLSGATADVARLDPERHGDRPRTTDRGG